MMTKNYDNDYQWLASRHKVSERLAQAATKMLHRIPFDDLAELQASNVKIDSKFLGLFRIGEAQREVRDGAEVVVCYVAPEMAGFSEAAMMGVLVHEFAHVRLGHCGLVLKSMTESERLILEGRHEIEANRLAIRWGFRAELKLADLYLQEQRRIVVENADKFIRIMG